MEELLLHNMRNAMVFCTLLAAMTLFPSPFLYMQRSFLRLGEKIQAWQRAMENPPEARDPKFWEIDMAKFDALENSKLSADR